jgi:hypothetical protein
MKVILIPELILDKKFEELERRIDVWVEVYSKRPDLIVQRVKGELTILQNDLKESK